MPTKPHPKKPHRFNLEMSDDVAARLDKLVAVTGADSKTEVIRRALATYEHLTDARAKGAEVFFEKSGKRTSVLL